MKEKDTAAYFLRKVSGIHSPFPLRSGSSCLVSIVLKKLKIELPYDPASPLAIYPGTLSFKRIHVPVLTAVAVSFNKTQTQQSRVLFGVRKVFLDTVLLIQVRRTNST